MLKHDFVIKFAKFLCPMKVFIALLLSNMCACFKEHVETDKECLQHTDEHVTTAPFPKEMMINLHLQVRINPSRRLRRDFIFIKII